MNEAITKRMVRLAEGDSNDDEIDGLREIIDELIGENEHWRREAVDQQRRYLEERARARRYEEAIEFALPVLQAYSIAADEEGFQTAASQMHKAHEVLVAALEGGNE